MVARLTIELLFVTPAIVNITVTMLAAMNAPNTA
jgi:hypothetical protein